MFFLRTTYCAQSRPAYLPQRNSCHVLLGPLCFHHKIKGIANAQNDLPYMKDTMAISNKSDLEILLCALKPQPYNRSICA